MFGEIEHGDPNRSVFFCGRLVQPGRSKSISNVRTIRSSIFPEIKPNRRSAKMPQPYGHVTQLGWNLYALSPWASFDYVLFPFIAVSKFEFAIVGRAGKRGKI